MNNPYAKTLEPVWQNLDYVFVNEEKLQELIKKIKKEKLKTPAWAIPNVHPPIDCKLAPWIDYVCWVSTVNFAFTNFASPYNKFTVEYPKGTFWSGSFALGASFMRAYNERSLILNPKDDLATRYIDPEKMSKISLKEVKSLFQAIDSAHQIPLVKERQKIFQEVGEVLLKKYNGSWLNLFLNSGFRAFNNGQGIVERLIADFPSFRDERIYKGYVLKFHKRAQLLVMIYHGRAVNSGGRFPEIRDIENIGPIADYTIPKVLRSLEVIRYAPSMEKAIRNHRIFYPGHPMEVENRLATSYVMKRISDQTGLTMEKIDFYIWSQGQKLSQPHILVKTHNY